MSVMRFKASRGSGKWSSLSLHTGDFVNLQHVLLPGMCGVTWRRGDLQVRNRLFFLRVRKFVLQVLTKGQKQQEPEDVCDGEPQSAPAVHWNNALPPLMTLSLTIPLSWFPVIPNGSQLRGFSCQWRHRNVVPPGSRPAKIEWQSEPGSDGKREGGRK